MRKKAFTLAEVLITLGIIGVVAAITIPTLMQKKAEQETAGKLKKAYSTLSQAFTLAVQENGTPDTWNLGGVYNSQGAINMLNIFANYLKLTKKCGVSAGCFPDVNYKFLTGVPSGDNSTYYDNPNLNFNHYANAQMSDGTLIGFTIRSSDCTTPRGTTPLLNNTCGGIVVDVNGFNDPNQLGIDTFCFYISKYGIAPCGTQQDTSVSFAGACKDKSTAVGNGCTAWVLYNENLDYLHCSSLSWTGATKCP